MEIVQPFDELDAGTAAALRASIERFGVIVPVVRDQHGRILDGHHRARIAAELDVEYSVVERHVANDAEARELARTLNADRRHLTREQRVDVEQALRADGHSLRAIAGAIGVDAKTVRNDLAGGDTSPPQRVSGTDGKSYPARRKPVAKPRHRAWAPITEPFVPSDEAETACPRCHGTGRVIAKDIIK